MKMLACAVYDEKAEAYLPPFYVAAPGQAIRLFEDSCNDKESQFGKHPGDYKLYRVGEFDDATAEFSMEKPALLASGSQWMEAQGLKVAR